MWLREIGVHNIQRRWPDRLSKPKRGGWGEGVNQTTLEVVQINRHVYPEVRRVRGSHNYKGCVGPNNRTALDLARIK